MMNRTRQLALGFAVILISLKVSSPANAATANANVVVQVAASASISATASVTLTPPATPFTGNYTGLTLLTFSIRTTPTTGSGSLTVQGQTEFTPGTAGDVGPTIAGGKLTYACASGDLTTGTGSGLSGTLTYCGGASQTVSMTTGTNVLTGIGAKSNAGGDTLNVHWTVPDSATYVVDTYTATVTFTLTAN